MARLREIPFSIENRRGDRVDGDVRLPEGDGPFPVVVMCHGFKGFKDWGPWPAWGRELARSGFASVLFNFSYNGVTPEAPAEFTEMERFAQNTFTRELDDMEAVIDVVSAGQLPEVSVAPGRLGLMGHSRGGGTAILQAASDARVKALATWSAVSGFVERFSPEQVDDWERQGYTEVINTRTGQRMRLNRVLYDDAMAHRDRLNILDAARRIERPWLIVHAENDTSVPFAEAQALAEAAPGADLFKAKGGHTFGGSHPFEGKVPETLRVVWDRTLAFFEEALAKEKALSSI